MKQPSLKHRIVNTLLMNIPVALAICLTAFGLSKLDGPSDNGLPAIATIAINFCIAYAVSFVVGMLIPLVPWGLAFATKCKAKPDSLPFGLLVNVIVNTGYVVCNCLILTYMNTAGPLGPNGGLPISAYFSSMAMGFVPIWVVGFIVSFLWNRPAEAITCKICKD